jgi:anoctamin-10
LDHLQTNKQLKVLASESLLYCCKRIKVILEIVPLWSKSRHLRALHENRGLKERSKLFAQSREWGRIFIDVSLIRSYYGDEVAIYFEWMNYFQKFLLYPGIFAVFVFIANNTIYTFNDSPISACYSVFMTFWGVFFMVNWSRHQRGLNILWDDYANKNNEEMHIRRQFRGVPRISPVTDKPDTHFSFIQRLPLYAVSFAICIPCLAACICVIICFLNMTGVIRPEHHGGVFDIPCLSALANPGAIFDPLGSMNMVAAAIQAVTTIVINLGFRRVAVWTAEFENHKTQR